MDYNNNKAVIKRIKKVRKKFALIPESKIKELQDKNSTLFDSQESINKKRLLLFINKVINDKTNILYN